MGNKPAVTLTIAGDADKLTRAREQATKDIDRLGDETTKNSTKMADATEKSSGRMSAAMGLAGAAVAGLAVAGAKHLFDLSKSMDALDVKAKTVFEGELPSMQAWAEANRKAFGESTRNVVGMAANLADLLKPMGFTTTQAADMSKKILDLSGALSRWTGNTKSAKEVSEILADAMLGETDSLKGLGISISAAEIEAKALSMGLGQTTVDMDKVKVKTFAVTAAQNKLSDAIAKHGKDSTQARDATLNLEKAQSALSNTMASGKTVLSDTDKALSTQQLILDKSTDAQKAWADGGRAASEAQNGLSSTMAESSEKLATIVAPAFAKLVEILGGIADWASKNQAAAITIGVVTAAVWLLNIALAANPIVLLVAAIAVAIGALIYFWTTSERFRSIVIGVFETVGNAVIGTVRWIVGAWESAQTFFDLLPTRIGRALGNLGEIIGGAFKFALNLAIDYVNFYINRLNDLIHGINWISDKVGIPGIPDVPRVARMHTGGTVPGMPGTERLILARAGENVSSGVGNGGGTEVRVTGSGGLAELIQAWFNDGTLVLVGR